VELLQIDRVDAEVLQTFLCVLVNMIGRIRLADTVGVECRPAHVLWRNFRRDNQLVVRMRLDRPSEQLLAFPEAVDPRGVEEVAAKLDRAIKRAKGLLVVGAGPSAHAPHAVPDFGNLPAGPAESPRANHEAER
jgi:hypothetical protein